MATPWQLLVALGHGVPRVLVTPTLVDPGVLAHQAGTPRTARVVVSTDSIAAVEAMARAHAVPPAQRLDVAVGLGAAGGRTGARGTGAALDVARAVAAAPGLRLAGVTGYEGALAHDGSPGSPEVVRGYVQQLAAPHTAVLDAGLLDPSVPGGSIVTAGGSTCFDVVAEVLAPLHDPAGGRGAPTRVLLRSGAYIAHDDGFCAGTTPMRRGPGALLRSAIHGWARVLSRPEPGLALVDAGKRDLPFDEGLPQVQGVRAGGTAALRPLPGAALTALDDQLALVALTGGARHPAVGDVLRLGLSHPCTAFDEWQLIPVIDDADAEQPVVVDLLRTVFG